MKKRKMKHDTSSQLKISTFFCKTAESTSPKELTHLKNSKSCDYEAKNGNEKANSTCFDENNIVTTYNEGTGRKLEKYDKVGVCSSSVSLHKPLKTVNIEDSAASTVAKSWEGLGERNECSSEICSFSELDSNLLAGFFQPNKVSKGKDSTSIRSFAYVTPTENFSNYCHKNDIMRDTTLSGQAGNHLVNSQEKSRLPLGNCNVNSEASKNVLVFGENDSNLRVTENSATPLSLESEVKGSIITEEIVDISLEEWDPDVCDQHIDGNIYNLQLNAVERCQVVSISCGPVENSKVLVVTSTKSKDMAKVLLQGIWASTCRVSPGDVISIQCCCRDEPKGWWVLDDNSATQMCLPTDGSLPPKLGFLVENPDLLMSGTSVVGSLFCARKGVLSDRFHGFEMAGIPPPLISPDSQGVPTTCGTPVNPTDQEQHSAAYVMLIGSLVHEVFQKSLSGSLRKPFEIGRVCHEVVSGRRALWDMYAARADFSKVRKEVMEFVPRIARFMERFLCGGQGVEWGRGENVDGSREWQGSIVEVRDIEECLWVPSLGLKGKVDVTLGVLQNGNAEVQPKKLPRLKEIPLELKTGKGSYSMEHQGQLLLYCAMMSVLGMAESPPKESVSSGLLLYLRAESMREIHTSRHALRDLILLRNDLVHYVMRGPTVMGGDMDKLWGGHCDASASLSLPVLPESIRHRRACSNCPYLTICSAHLKCEKGLEEIPVDHPMSLLAPQALKHLSPTHLNYFVRWSCLVGLEHEDCVKDDSRTHLLWTMGPWEREKIGRCISYLHVKEIRSALIKERSLLGEGFSSEGLIHCFVRAAEAMVVSECSQGPSRLATRGDSPPLPSSTFSVGERVMVSWEDRIAVSSGIVLLSGGDMLAIGIDRDLTQRYGSGRFHVDKYEYASTTSSYSLTSLGLLLSDTWSADRLRQLIIDRKAPKFLKKLSGRVVSSCSPILKGLNKSQVRAVLSAMAAQDFLLVKGLPGTGKSATVVAMVQAFVSTGHSVLVTGHTHSSVDNIMSRLVEVGGLGDSLVRLGSPKAVDAALLPYLESTLVASCRTPKDIERVFLSKAVVGATCMGCAVHPLISSRAFDVCILDEAGQVLLPISLRPIFSSRVFILVGDPEQLPPVVRSHRARSLGLEQTLFTTLESPEACVTLDVQYRMNSVITRLANDLSYGSRLICANEQVASSVVHFPGQTELDNTYSEDSWLFEVLSSEVEQSVVIIDTGDTLHLTKEDYYPKQPGVNRLSNEENLHRYENICEAGLTFYIVKALLMGGVKATEVGVIAPYTDQVYLLRRVLGTGGGQEGSSEVEVSTVDQFQGRDKEIIIYSFTRSGAVSAAEVSKTKGLQLLSNKHRLTVAITRAKRKLICIGHLEVLRTYSVLKDFISLIPENNIIDLCRGGSGFSWARVFNSMPLST